MMDSQVYIAILSALGALFIAVVFLFIGWRLGRESSDRPMFAFPPFPGSPAQPEQGAGGSDDPWGDASIYNDEVRH